MTLLSTATQVAANGIENVNVTDFDPMPSPEETHARVPLSGQAAQVVMRGREALRDILDRFSNLGRDFCSLVCAPVPRLASNFPSYKPQGAMDVQAVLVKAQALWQQVLADPLVLPMAGSLAALVCSIALLYWCAAAGERAQKKRENQAAGTVFEGGVRRSTR